MSHELTLTSKFLLVLGRTVESLIFNFLPVKKKKVFTKCNFKCSSKYSLSFSSSIFLSEKSLLIMISHKETLISISSVDWIRSFWLDKISETFSRLEPATRRNKAFQIYYSVLFLSLDREKSNIFKVFESYGRRLVVFRDTRSEVVTFRQPSWKLRRVRTPLFSESPFISVETLTRTGFFLTGYFMFYGRRGVRKVLYLVRTVRSPNFLINYTEQ